MSDDVRRVAVTGASGYIGRLLTGRLLAETQIERVLAIDVVSPKEAVRPGLEFVRHDISSPMGDILSDHDIDAVVHLAYVLRPRRDRAAVRRVNVGGTENLLAGCAKAGVSSFVYLSSTSVYGAHVDNPEALTEEHPPRPVDGYQYSEDKVESERLIQQFARKHPDVTATILRCCPVIGPNADNFITQALQKPFLVAVGNHDPEMQLVHEDDLTEVLALCTLSEAPGVYNVAGEETLSWREMVEKLGSRLLPLPASILYPATELAWKLRLQSDSNSAGLDLIRYPWVASTEKIKRDLRVRFRHSSREALEAFVAARRLAEGSHTADSSSKTHQDGID